MTRTRLAKLLGHFASLPDPRIHRSKLHDLADLIVLAICGILAGCNEYTAIAAFGQAKQGWLKGFLRWPNGIPSHDTIGRVLALPAPAAFDDCFGRWMAEACDGLGLKQVAVDGKALRGSRGKLAPCLHLVSAFATANGVTLGQRAVAEKSNEITAIPELLRALDVAGAVVTIDAMGCQKEIAETTRAAGADYLLAVKGNQETLRRDVESFALAALEKGCAGVDYSYHEEPAAGHGRGGFRACYVFNDPSFVTERDKWRDLACVVMVVAERVVAGKATSEVRYYIGSRRRGAKWYARVVRDHWAIENELHWMLDVHFDDDRSRVRVGHGPANFAWLKKAARAMLRQAPGKDSVTIKRLKAAWDTEFLEKILLCFLEIY
jgi:predicted transposase YbfD/YdcC